MFNKIWRKHVTEPRRLRKCVDYGFVPNTELDALCKRFDDSLCNMWYARADAAGRRIAGQLENDGTTEARIRELVAEQKAIQEEGGQELLDYLAPYFAVAKQWRDGKWGTHTPPTIPGGWIRFRTANNWRT